MCLRTLVFMSALICGLTGSANAWGNGHYHGDPLPPLPWQYVNHQQSRGIDSVPELDLTLLGGGIATFLGGILFLNERRRKRQAH